MRKGKLKTLIQDINSDDIRIQLLRDFLETDEIKSLKEDDNILFSTFWDFANTKIDAEKIADLFPKDCLTFHHYIKAREFDLNPNDRLSSLPPEIRIEHIFKELDSKNQNKAAASSRLFNADVKATRANKTQYANWRKQFIDNGFNGEELDTVFNSNTVNDFGALFKAFMHVQPKPKHAAELLCLTGEAPAIDYAFKFLNVDIGDTMTLRYVCMSGNLNAIDELIKKGMPVYNINHRINDHKIDYMLFYIFESGREEIYDEVLKRIKNNPRGYNLGMSDFPFFCGLSGDFKIIQYAISKLDKYMNDYGMKKYGDEVLHDNKNKLSHDGDLMMSGLILSGNVSAFNALLQMIEDKKIKIDASDWEKYLFSSASSCSIEMIDRMLGCYKTHGHWRHRDNIESLTDFHDIYFLQRVAESGSINCVRHLLQLGWNASVETLHTNLLDHAAHSGSIELVNHLLKLGFNPTALSHANRISFYRYAVLSGCVEMINFAESVGMSTLCPDAMDMVRVAIISGNVNALKLVFEIYNVSSRNILENKDQLNNWIDKSDYPSIKLFVKELIMKAEKELESSSKFKLD